LDGKGYTPEGNTVILDEHAAKSENEVTINEKTAEDNVTKPPR
jgi:CobQ-like glutamine amidotransferase family enzyme